MLERPAHGGVQMGLPTSTLFCQAELTVSALPGPVCRVAEGPCAVKLTESLPEAMSSTCDSLCPEGMGEATRPSLTLDEVKICPLSSQQDPTPVQGPFFNYGQHCPQLFSGTGDPYLVRKGL